MRCGVVLQRAEVEHLVTVAEVDRGEVALRALAGEQRLGAKPGVRAAERDHRGAQRRVAAQVRALQCDLPRVRAVLLHRDVAHVGTVAQDELDDRVDEVADRLAVADRGRRPAVGRAVPVEHRDLGRLARDDERVGEGGEAVALLPVEHHDGRLDHDPGGHLDDRAADQEGVVQEGEGVGRRVGARAQEPSSFGASQVARPHTSRPWPRGASSSEWCTTRPLRTTTRPARSPASAATGPPPGAASSRARRASSGGTGRKRSRSRSPIRL